MDRRESGRLYFDCCYRLVIAIRLEIDRNMFLIDMLLKKEVTTKALKTGAQ